MASTALVMMLTTASVSNTRSVRTRRPRTRWACISVPYLVADSRTSVPTIFAIGDLTHRRNLTPVAIAEGRAVADLLYGGGGRHLDYAMVPTAVFSSPAVGAVGLTESDARARGHEVDIYKSSFRPLKHTLSGSDERAMVKLVVDAKTGRVLGAHMVGADAAEIIQSLAVALTAGVTKAQFDATVALHPSAAEEFVLLRTKVQPVPA